MKDAGTMTKWGQERLLPMEAIPHKAVEFISSSAENVVASFVNVGGVLFMIFVHLKKKSGIFLFDGDVKPEVQCYLILS